MVRTLRARWLSTAAFLLLAAFAVGFAGDLVHTDDGCQVEVHCLACQRVLVSVGVATVATQWAPSSLPVERIAIYEQVATDEPGGSVAGSRAPPLA